MITIKEMANGFQYIEVKNDMACANIALQGAHIFHYVRQEEEPILWLSDMSDFEHDKSIRGGVPICWPWFGMNKRNSNLPQHGFARTLVWELQNSEDRDKNTTHISLKLSDSSETFSLWPYRFELIFNIIISDTLVMELITTNLDEKPFEITQALHSYFNISDITNVAVQGLDKKPYFDALTSKHLHQEGDVIFDKEVDRVYQNVSDEILLLDNFRTIRIKNEGSSSAVVWNPWIEKCARMSAMSEDAYLGMLCIESANAMENCIVIASQNSHTLRATIS